MASGPLLFSPGYIILIAAFPVDTVSLKNYIE
jgi:hypothetical protein